MCTVAQRLMFPLAVLFGNLAIGPIVAADSPPIKQTKDAFVAGTGGIATAGPACQALCPADITENGVIDIDDLVQVITNWNAAGGPADVNHSGGVNIDDLVQVITHWGSCPPPQNDSCLNPITITAGGTAFCTSSAVTDGSSEPGCNFCCGDTQINQDIWFRYIAPYSGAVQFTTCGSADFDTKIAVYHTGGGCSCANGLFLLACNDDACGDLQSKVHLNMSQGECFFVRVGGYLGGKGSGTLTTQEFFTEDECFNAFYSGVVAPNTWNGIYTASIGHHAGVTVPVSSCGGGNDTIDKWYTFQINCGGPHTTTITTCADTVDFDTVLAVYGGTCDNLVELACNDDSPLPNCQLGGLNRKSNIAISNLQPLTTYYIRVSGYLGATGNIYVGIYNGCP